MISASDGDIEGQKTPTVILSNWWRLIASQAKPRGVREGHAFCVKRPLCLISDRFRGDLCPFPLHSKPVPGLDFGRERVSLIGSAPAIEQKMAVRVIYFIPNLWVRSTLICTNPTRQLNNLTACMRHMTRHLSVGLLT